MSLVKTYSGSDSDILIRFSYMVKEGKEYKRHETNWVPLEGVHTISLSSTITTIPIRTGGHSRPDTYVTGYRTCAGTIVFTDDVRWAPLEKVIKNLLKDSQVNFKTNPDELYFDSLPLMDILIVTIPEDILVNSNYVPLEGYEINGMSNSKLSELIKSYTKLHGFFGVKFRDLGTTISTHDMYTEKTMTYVAQQFVPDIKNWYDWKEVLTWYNQTIQNKGIYYFSRLLEILRSNKDYSIADLNQFLSDKGWK